MFIKKQNILVILHTVVDSTLGHSWVGQKLFHLAWKKHKWMKTGKRIAKPLEKKKGNVNSYRGSIHLHTWMCLDVLELQVFLSLTSVHSILLKAQFNKGQQNYTQLIVVCAKNINKQTNKSVNKYVRHIMYWILNCQIAGHCWEMTYFPTSS